MTSDYTPDEVRRILGELWDGASLEQLHCPRDRAVLRVFFSRFRPDARADEVEGVLYGVWGDVTEISLECPSCGAGRARIALRRPKRARSRLRPNNKQSGT